MRMRALTRALALVAFVPLTACSADAPLELDMTAQAEAEALALSDQVRSVQARVEQNGELTDADRAEIESLADAFDAWGERWDRDDIRVRRGSDGGSDSRLTGASAKKKSSNGPSTCYCPDITVDFLQICFLARMTCQEGSTMCVYNCFTLITPKAQRF